MRYYIETDGRIFLVERDGYLDLPRPDEVPFEVELTAPLGEGVWFCTPHLPAHPSDWPGKDEVPERPDVTPAVRAAVHASMPRVIVEGIHIEGDSILLVKGSRGLTAGLWSLPGGFLRFGETPEEGLLREIREELRTDAEMEGFLSVRAKLGSRSRLHWIMFFYRVKLASEPNPDPDEIEEARLFPISQASDIVSDPTIGAVISSLKRG
ncbi:hypothetical protein DRJ12_03490 [Candidatus Acetothermia bacterium]|nr:MAG: hypothetical protein DRJ12_03490 [Candidatus Acetothermia bacterium]